MQSNLSQQQTERIRASVAAGNFKLESEIERLKGEGIEEVVAKGLVATVINNYRTELFQQSLEKKNTEEAQKIAVGATFMISAIGPLFGIQSPLWYVVVAIAAGFAGYYGFKERPAAGIVGCLAFAFIFPFAYHYYFSGRRSFIRIEMVIPMLMAMVPAGALYWILSNVLYSDED